MTEVKKGTGKWKILIIIVVALAFGYFLFTNMTTHTVEPLNVVAVPLAGVAEQAVLYLKEPTRIMEAVQDNRLGYSIMTSLGGSVMWIAGKVFYGRIIGNKDLVHKNDQDTISALINTQTKSQTFFDAEKGTLNTQLTEANRRVELAEEKTKLTTQLMEKRLGEKETQVQDQIKEIASLNRSLAEKHVYERVITK